ncbi:hypothetical protein [Rhizobium sp. ICMP 5592]|uniref:hypothetical protein n=1 Tax=Rhizobium sp. ICMP 5592 TaxID=2292445 RepID=UPI0012956450|nr:hypothetical protein [Rhizobium sp. ICMP 5592]MQB43392.1 hypothetical protein [Rhizobium sp. ICMP 5592]
MALPYPIPEQLRITDIFTGNGASVYGPFTFKIFDVDDVEVWTLPAGALGFAQATVSVIKLSDEPFDYFTVEFLSGQPETTKIVVVSMRLDSRSAGVISGTKIDPTALEKELSKIATIEQELRRDINRSVKSDFGAPPFVIDSLVVDGSYLKVSGNRLVSGLDLDAVVSELHATDSELATALQSETIARTAADTVINARIDVIVGTVEGYTSRAEAAAEEAEGAANAAHQLVIEATAGFSGFLDGQGYDFGYITDATTYFDQNWGTIV